MKKILVMKVFGIGNVINATPMLKAVRKAHPNARIDVLCDRAGAAAITGWLALDDVWTFTPGEAVQKMPGYDAYVISRPANGWTMGAVPLGGRLIGAWTDRECWKQHEIEWNMELALELGYSGPVPDPHFECGSAVSPLPHDDRPTAGVHIGCLPTWSWKKWPIEKWAELIDRLGDAGFRVVVIGGEAERSDVNKLKKATRRFVDLCGQTTLKEAGAVIRGCDLFISTDSGPMHMASALKVPVVGIFGPTSVKKNRPWRGLVVRHREAPLPCQPCQERPDGMAIMRGCDHRMCLTQLEAQEVFEAAMGYLEAHRVSKKAAGKVR